VCLRVYDVYVRAYIYVAYMYLETRRLGRQKEQCDRTYYAYSCNNSKNDVSLNCFKQTNVERTRGMMLVQKNTIKKNYGGIKKEMK
jgi:hypothetical protein